MKAKSEALKAQFRKKVEAQKNAERNVTETTSGTLASEDGDARVNLNKTDAEKKKD